MICCFCVVSNFVRFDFELTRYVALNCLGSRHVSKGSLEIEWLHEPNENLNECVPKIEALGIYHKIVSFHDLNTFDDVESDSSDNDDPLVSVHQLDASYRHMLSQVTDLVVTLDGFCDRGLHPDEIRLDFLRQTNLLTRLELRICFDMYWCDPSANQFWQNFTSEADPVLPRLVSLVFEDHLERDAVLAKLQSLKNARPSVKISFTRPCRSVDCAFCDR